jgi:ketosteroid isomerase-like protein
MSAEDEVRKASKEFYAALSRMCHGDARSLADVWSHGTAVTAMHPIGGREVGWEAVKQSFAKVAELSSAGKVELKDQLIHVAGDLAYEVGVEHGQIKLAGRQVDINVRVTNVYQRRTGAWKMVHHHTDTSAAMLDVLHGLQAASGQAKK